MTVDEIYELTANNIVNNINAKSWEKAILNIHGSDTAMGIDGAFFSEGKEYPLEVCNFDVDVEFALMELHEITTEDGENQWNCAVFTIFPSGEFNIDFSWDDEIASEEE